MLRRSFIKLHSGGHRRPFHLREPSYFESRSTMGIKKLLRAGALGTDRPNLQRFGTIYARGAEHAFPLLSHTDFGNQDHWADTHWITLGNYMPKKVKGGAPWHRGADTYSVLYTEQGRYEYLRYLMISRFPSQYKRSFHFFLANIRKTKKPKSSHVSTQETLHWLLRMIVDNFNPQHIHYLAAMQTLIWKEEYDMARDVWRIMERQQTWPDDKLIAQYLELCATMREKALAIECWNRYCNEKKFLEHGEADPKPISRIPFTLNRDETLYLPKWKKHFDHDPNLDVVDLNRFNTTRNIYRAMALAMIACNDRKMFETFYTILEEKLLSTPSPIPEPPNPHLVPKPTWGPHLSQASLKRTAWRYSDCVTHRAYGPSEVEIDEMHPRFLSNEQFLLTTASNVIEEVIRIGWKGDDPLGFCNNLIERVFSKLSGEIKNLDTRRFFTAILEMHRKVRKARGMELHDKMEELHRRKNSEEAEFGHQAMYLSILQGFENDCDAQINKEFDPRTTMQEAALIITDINVPSFVWSADIHLAVMKILLMCGTMKCNDYFVTNVLRQYTWDSEFCKVLFQEYRRHDDVELWAELTKRMLVWTARYDVILSEEAKRMIEEDYDTIKVQVRSLRDLVVFKYRHMEEERIAKNPVNQLPNPWMDYVSHALPFPDRDTGYPNEYGELGQWRVPESGGELSTTYGTKGPTLFSPELHGDAQLGYYGQWKDNSRLHKGPHLPPPWDRKYAQYQRGTHPSYDMVYAGPFPEIFPARRNFRRPTRWDFQQIESQSKYTFGGPF